MDCQDYITELVERKKGQHLQREEQGAIQHLKNAGYTNRAIARAIGCSPTTVGNELKRGTPPRKSSKGRKPGYSARRGEAAYKAKLCGQHTIWIRLQTRKRQSASLYETRAPTILRFPLRQRSSSRKSFEICGWWKTTRY